MGLRSPPAIIRHAPGPRPAPRRGPDSEAHGDLKALKGAPGSQGVFSRRGRAFGASRAGVERVRAARPVVRARRGLLGLLVEVRVREGVGLLGPGPRARGAREEDEAARAADLARRHVVLGPGLGPLPDRGPVAVAHGLRVAVLGPVAAPLPRALAEPPEPELGGELAPRAREVVVVNRRIPRGAVERPEELLEVLEAVVAVLLRVEGCLLYTSPSPRD